MWNFSHWMCTLVSLAVSFGLLICEIWGFHGHVVITQVFWNVIMCCWLNVLQHSFKMLGTTYQIILHHSLEGMKPQVYFRWGWQTHRIDCDYLKDLLDMSVINTLLAVLTFDNFVNDVAVVVMDKPQVTSC